MSSEFRTIHPVYQKQKLDVDRDCIRLLTISPGTSQDALHCGLVVVPLASDTAFEAVSYTWGQRDLGYLINIDDEYHGFPVGSNLLELLLNLRQTQAPRTVWIDAICINQGDLLERSRQVKMMRKIYSSARQVIIWLGPATHQTAPAIHYINSFIGEKQLDVIPPFVRHTVLDMCRQAYWTRIWIVQEVIAARQITVICGRLALAWRTFERIVDLVTHNEYAIDEIEEEEDLTHRV